MNQRFLLVVVFAIALFSAQAQQKKSITLQDIWAKPTFRAKGFEGFKWMKNDNHYTSSGYTANKYFYIVKHDVTTGNALDTILKSAPLNAGGEDLVFEDYSFSPDEKKVLLTVGEEKIYRRSTRAYYFVVNLLTKQLNLLSDSPISYPAFSPDASKIAFVKDNNLFIYDFVISKETQVTTDGAYNSIINGSTDWVYEEEFEFAPAFFWSPDGKKIAFYRFDESRVKEYNMELFSGLYPTDYKYKYPVAGKDNSEVVIKLYYLDNAKTETVDYKSDYFPRIKWTSDPDVLSVVSLNRNQNNYSILNYDTDSKKIKTIYEEKNTTYVEVNDNLRYLKPGKGFLLSSEKDGYRHIYHYDNDGKLIKQVTKGNWEVDNFLGVDEKTGSVYYTSTEESPMQRQLYKISISGENKVKISSEKGYHQAEMSPNLIYYVDNFTTATAPPSISLYSASGKKIKALEDNKALQETISGYKTSALEFFSFTTESNTSLNAWMIKPAGFNPAKKYPVLLTIYGGPGHQTVTEQWGGPNYLWYQMLADKGYIIVAVDGRGTGGRGAEFKKITQLKLGKYETEDVINTAKYLKKQAYVNGDKIGVFGWSFGGYLSSLAITLGADYFSAAIAVAPVISWRYYDTIYTERYLGLPKDNAEGYDLYSPLSHADKLKGNYLLIHGTADDNVHVQNSMAMQTALVKANKQFQCFYYPDKNHGIYGGNTRLHLFQQMTDFLDKSLTH